MMKGIQESPVKVFSCYKDVPSCLSPIVLTIGNFDAVHTGHCAVLAHAKKIAEKINGNLCVLTFTAHPAEVLRPGIHLPKLCTQEHKLKLLEQQEVDVVIFFEFTLSFSQQTAEEFLKTLQKYIPFSALVLGHDALIGKDRQGDSLAMHQIAALLGFDLIYIPPHQVEGMVVSSSAIRRAIREGNLEAAEKMLGRKFSILTTIQASEDRKAILSNVSSLCMPPNDIYPVMVLVDSLEVPAEAILKKESFIELIFKENIPFVSGQMVEVIWS